VAWETVGGGSHYTDPFCLKTDILHFYSNQKQSLFRIFVKRRFFVSGFSQTKIEIKNLIQNYFKRYRLSYLVYNLKMENDLLPLEQKSFNVHTYMLPS
jgi:hypothetical protein